MIAVMERKRYPLVRPLCPIHMLPMVVYAGSETIRYHRCVMPACACRSKTVKQRRTDDNNSGSYLQREL